MNFIAQSKSVRISPRKVRLVADAIRKLSVEEALKALAVIDKRGAYGLEKTIKSAVANAKNRESLNENDLILERVEVMEGPALKRYHPSTRGRVHPYKKKSSHIKIILNKKETKV